MGTAARRPRRGHALLWRAAAILAAQLPLCRTDSAEPSPCGVEWAVTDDGALQLAGWSLLSTFSLPAPEPAGTIRHHALPAGTAGSGATPWESLAVTIRPPPRGGDRRATSPRPDSH